MPLLVVWRKCWDFKLIYISRYDYDIQKHFKLILKSLIQAEIEKDNNKINNIYFDSTDNTFYYELDDKTIIDNAELMKEGEMVSISINTEDNTPLSAEMPASVILEIKHTEPGLKGNTATNATKPATLETGAIVNVPLFINEGDKIKVDTEKGHYIERIKIN